MPAPRTNSRLRKILRQVREPQSGWTDVFPAVTGKANGTILTGINGLIFVRNILNGQVLTVYNSIAPTDRAGLQIEVGRMVGERGIWRVKGIRDSYGVPAGGGQISPHTHEELFISGDHVLPFLIFPSSEEGGFVVQVVGGVVNLGGTRYALENQSLDLSSYQPASGAIWVLIEVDSTGALNVVEGDEVEGKELLTVSNIPPFSQGAWEMCAIRLYAGQTAIQRDPNDPNTNDFVDLRFGRATNSSPNIMMPVIGTPNVNTLTEDFNTRGSSGVIDGTITYIEMDTGSHKVKVAAGEGYLRTTNDQQGVLKIIEWSAVTQIDIPAPAAGFETVRFIGVEYNSGNPQVTTRTTFNWNWYDDFPLGRVSYDGTTLRILNAYAHAEDTANFARKFLRLTMPFQREEAPEGTGGIELSEVATRQLAVSAGNVWHGFNRYLLNAITAGTAFDIHYRKAGGGFVSTTGVTQWPNTQYDDGSGTLVTMTNNRHACLWVFIDVADNTHDVIYGRGQYTSIALAQAEAIPTAPDHLNYHGRLIARIIFEKSAAAAELIESAWATTFKVGGGGGTGDMLKATYDTDNDGTVDNSEALIGIAGANFARMYFLASSPSTTDDINDGYREGDFVAVTSFGVVSTVWWCYDNTAGAAVWKQISDSSHSHTEFIEMRKRSWFYQ